jgi:hypothetical protein
MKRSDAMQSAFDPKWDSPKDKILYRELGEVDILKLWRVILGNLPDPDYIGHRAYWAK